MAHKSMKFVVGRYLITENKSFDFGITWTIENFLLRSQDWKDSGCLSSPNFTSDTLSGLEWKAEVHINNSQGDDENTKVDSSEKTKIDEEKYVALNFHLQSTLSNNVDSVSAAYSCFILDALKNKVHSRQEFGTFESDVKGWEKFIKWQDLKNNSAKYLPGGHLTLECRVKAYVNFKSPKSIPATVSYKELCFDTLSKMRDNEIHSDVVLKTEEKEFKCHKSVLSARSLHFHRLLKENHGATVTKLFDFTGILNVGEMGDLLRFIYTGEARNLEANCRKLYLEADKHGMQDLKEKCEIELIKQVKPDTAVDLLHFALNNGALKLKKVAATCIAES